MVSTTFGSRVTMTLVLALAASLLLALYLGAMPARADATFAVTKTADTADGACDSDCSLREAVVAANLAAGADEITVPAGTYTLTLRGGGDGAHSPDAGVRDLDITDDITITGAGKGETVVEAGDSAHDGADPGADRVFEAWDPGTTATISDLTVRNGYVPFGSFTDLGGGVRNNGADLTLRRVAVADNYAHCTGGGVFNWQGGTLRLHESTVSGNGTNGGSCGGGSGGGIQSEGGTLHVVRTTVADNASGAGGGVFGGGTLRVSASTFDGNAADAGGGGILFVGGSASVHNSTFSGNRSSTGGGVSVGGNSRMEIEHSTLAGNRITVAGRGGAVESFGAVEVSDTILAGNALAQGGADNCAGVSGGTVVSAGHNLESPGNTCNLGAAGDRPGTDPMLGPLGDNGGPTETRALSPESPALDTGSTAGFLDTDQRGVSRTRGAGSDVGAFELDATAPTAEIEAPAQGATYAEGEDVRADYACTDDAGGSGIRSCTGTAADGASIDTSTPGTFGLTVWAEDRDGNVAEATRAYTVAATDRTAPEVLRVSPTVGKASPKANIKATFSEAMDPGSLNGSTFRLTRLGAARPVAAKVTTGVDGRAATLDPRRKLASGATYKATISTGAKDPAGNTIPASKTWKFRVKR